jgi:hypothetical protein
MAGLPTKPLQRHPIVRIDADRHLGLGDLDKLRLLGLHRGGQHPA